MNVLICYFSGTGNTHRVAQRFAECFVAAGHQAEMLRLDETATEKSLPDNLLQKIQQCDLLGIGYPVYAFNAPPILLHFAKKLPKITQKKHTFLFNTSGEPLKLNNISSLKLSGMLRRRRFDVTNEYHYCMPYNILFRHSDEMAHKMWQTACNLIPLDTAQIVNGEKHLLKRVFAGGALAWAMRCEQWGGRLNGRMYRVSKECINCYKCVNDCPTHNITVNKKGKLHFGGKCLMCMRCAHLCPKNAIKIGLFNKWKVNGAYSFDEPTTKSGQRYNKMLTKAYDRYFEEAQRRTSSLRQVGDNPNTKPTAFN